MSYTRTALFPPSEDPPLSCNDSLTSNEEYRDWEIRLDRKIKLIVNIDLVKDEDSFFSDVTGICPYDYPRPILPPLEYDPEKDPRWENAVPTVAQLEKSVETHQRNYTFKATALKVYETKFEKFQAIAREISQLTCASIKRDTQAWNVASRIHKWPEPELWDLLEADILAAHRERRAMRYKDFRDIFEYFCMRKALRDEYFCVDATSRQDYIAQLIASNDNGPDGPVTRRNLFVKILLRLENFAPPPTAQEKYKWWVDSTPPGDAWDKVIEPLERKRALGEPVPYDWDAVSSECVALYNIAKQRERHLSSATATKAPAPAPAPAPAVTSHATVAASTAQTSTVVAFKGKGRCWICGLISHRGDDCTATTCNDCGGALNDSNRQAHKNEGCPVRARQRGPPKAPHDASKPRPPKRSAQQQKSESNKKPRDSPHSHSKYVADIVARTAKAVGTAVADKLSATNLKSAASSSGSA